MAQQQSPLERHRLPLSIHFHPSAGNPTPVRCTIDFAQELGWRPDAGFTDPHTFVVKRELNGNVAEYPVQFDEKLLYCNQGWIAWLVDDPHKGGEWALEFRMRSADGLLTRRGSRPVVGVGDTLSHGDGQLHPIGVPGMDQFPIAVDWNGDGLIDILSSSHYANTQGMPWSGIFVWRNTGSNQEPRFGPPMRLYARGAEQVDASQYRLREGSGPTGIGARGNFLSEYYLRCDVFDWFGSGLPDLITASKQAGIRVYRNCGELDAAGLPLLEHALTVELPSCLPPTPYVCPRVVDWDGSGRPSLLIGAPYIVSGIDHGQMVLLRNVSTSPGAPRFETVLLARSNFWSQGGATDDWRKINNFPGFRAFSFDYADVDGDGQPELLVCHGRHIPWPVIEVWRNAGTPDRPRLVQDGFLPWSSHYMHFGFRFVANDAFDGCLLAGRNGASGICYLERVHGDPYGADSFVDRGPLLGDDDTVRVEGWSRPSLVETEEGASLICGDEPGFLSRMAVARHGGRFVIGEPAKLRRADGETVHLFRESILHDNDLDRFLGHTKPAACDWDGDGELDLIVGHNTNRIFWLRAYDPASNTFREMHELRVEGCADPFAWRAGPAATDFDGDGRPELITADAQKRICLFRQGTGAHGCLVLEPPVPLRYDTGEIVTSTGIPPAIYAYGMVCVHVCDWDQDGVNDLLVSTNYATCFLRNVGSNREPLLAQPLMLSTPDGPIEIGHHETSALSWDWDQDGRPDLIIGGESGALYAFHRDFLDGIEHEVRVVVEVGGSRASTSPSGSRIE